MKIIAIEEHFHTKSYVKYLHTRTEAPRREFVEENGQKFLKDWWAPNKFRLMELNRPDNYIADIGQKRLQEMDAAGIDMQILSLSFPGVELFNDADGATMARVVNDELAEAVQTYPDRFAGFAALPAQDPTAAALELERAVSTLGLKGAMINGHINGAYLDEPRFWPIFEKAEALNVPIYIHPKMPSADMLKPYLAYPGLASAIWGFAADAGLHAVRLILSGVFDKYPGLKIILGHLGEAIPFWLARMDNRLEEEKASDPVSAKAYEHLKKTPSQYFKDHFYVSTSGMLWAPVMQYVCSVLGADKVMFAADFPYESGPEAVALMKSMPLSEAEKALICHQNAESLFNL
jgi:5-carboxyvanillate decarboxylase